MDRLPVAIYIYFPDATWTIGKLPKGVYALQAKPRMWTVNKFTGIKARRRGFTLVPDFASTPHMVQSATLNAALADFQDKSTSTCKHTQKYSKKSLLNQKQI